jgi:hypothetical protein
MDRHARSWCENSPSPRLWGKDYPLWCGNKLMIEVGAKSLLGPHEFVSGRGIIKYLKSNPLTLCIVDELGDVFQLINGQQDNPWVTDLIGHFKKLYNSWEIIITAETMKDESTTINHPAVSIVGACTPQALFEALKPRDLESGFANRPMLLPFEGFKRPSERDCARRNRRTSDEACCRTEEPDAKATIDTQHAG